MPFFILLVCFIFVPIMEISVLFKVGAHIGPINTVLCIIFTAVLGAYLVREQGVHTLRRIQSELQQGRVPAQGLLEGVMLLIAGAVLLTPGFISDVLGFVLLIPYTRKAIIAWYIHRKGAVFTPQSRPNGSAKGRIIEGEAQERD